MSTQCGWLPPSQATCSPGRRGGSLHQIAWLSAVSIFRQESVDYPDIAEKVCADVLDGSADRGIVLCGTGIGISIAANKIKGIRCALCNDVYSARMSRAHNDANVLAMGGRVIGPGPAEEIVRVWVKEQFQGGRHERRVNKIMLIQDKQP